MKLSLCLPLAAASLLLPLSSSAEDILVSDFEFSTWAEAGWTTTGSAFGAGPAEGTLGRQQAVTNFQGERLVNSFFDGNDRETGTLTSPDFTIQKKFINFLIGGGGWDGTCMNLLIEGNVVLSASGDNREPGGSERLNWKTWDVSKYLHKKATLQIIDNERGGWGHITVDHIVQSDTPTAQLINEATPRPSHSSGASDSFEALMTRIREFERVAVPKDSPHYARIAEEVQKVIGREGMTQVDQMRAARELRSRLHADPYRPTYHLLPPEGPWNDVNGAIFWKGRYHLFFLGRQAPDLETILSGKDTMRSREIWLHASSADLLHWVWHPTALPAAFDGTMLRGVFSGGAVAGADVPTLIYHIPGQGTCIATADDDMLVHWTPHPKNPVIPQRGQSPEVIVFDPAAWKDGDNYYALVGNKNHRPGYEGDTCSLYRSRDLVNWEYLHPFYKSDRQWTHVDEDAACPDFFPIGKGKHMLVTHIHGPMYRTQYYIGALKGETFVPEQHGYMSWPGGQMSGPETLLDGKGRRIFFGWLREAKPMRTGWSSMTSLPRVLSLAEDNSLRITPAPELAQLRVNERSAPSTPLADGKEHVLPGIEGNTVEFEMIIEPGSAKEIAINVLRSPNGEEQTSILYSPKDKTLTMECGRSSLDLSVRYEAYDRGYATRNNIPEAERFTTRQTAPLDLPEGAPLKLRIFIDRSVVEVFANDVQCVTQRVYPTLKESRGVSLSTKGGEAKLTGMTAWDMAPTNSW